MPELSTSTGDNDQQTCTVPAEAAIGRLAAGQHGVVARRQLATLGVTETMIRDRMRSGQLLRLHAGVYAVGHRQLRREGIWLAAVLALGPGAALSHRDAAGLHDLRAANHARVDVTTTRRGTRPQPGIELRRTTVLDARDVTVVGAIPVTTIARTLVDLASVLPRQQLARALREADIRRAVDAHDVEDALSRTRNRPGSGHATLRAVLEEHRDRGLQLTRSVLEDRFLALLAAHGLPRPATNARVGPFEVDAFWPARRLVVELDGWQHHHDRVAFQRDRDKGNALIELGCTVLRFTHDDVARDPVKIAAQLRALLKDA